MAHNLIELDEYTTPIVVPDGADSRSNASAVVTAIAQALANRTNLFALHAAFHDADNNFSVLQTFIDGLQVDDPDAGHAALRLLQPPEADAVPGNRYKAVLRAKCGGGVMDGTLYTGITPGQAQLVIAVNAVWNPGPQLWLQQDAAQPSSALLMTYNGVFTLSRQAPGTPSWLTWPDAGASVLRAGTGYFDLASGTNVHADTDVTADNNVVATANVVAGSDFLYAAPRDEVRAIPLSSGVSTSANAIWAGDRWTVQGAFNFLAFPLVPPATIGGLLGEVDVMLHNPGGAPLTYNLYLRQHSGIGWGPPVLPTLTSVDTATGSIAGGATIQVTLDWAATQVFASRTYWLMVDGAGGGANPFEVRAIRLAFTNPGPV